jgi:hypothetical protein
MNFIDACASGHIDTVKFMLNKTDSYFIIEGFKQASYYGHIDIVKLLIKKGCNPEYNYAFQWSVYNGHIDIVRLLLKYGCDINCLDYSHILFCDTKVFKLLLDKGLDPSISRYNYLFRDKLVKINLKRLLIRFCIAKKLSLKFFNDKKLIDYVIKEIINEILLVYELKIPEELCRIISVYVYRT